MTGAVEGGEMSSGERAMSIELSMGVRYSRILRVYERGGSDESR